MLDASGKEHALFKFEADNLIYNRFDLIYKENVERFFYEYDGKKYAIDAHYNNSVAEINVWGKPIPLNVFENAITDIFLYHTNIRCIEIKRSRNNYHQFLEKCNDIRISLPETTEQLLQRVRAKHRSAIKRMKKLLGEYGNLEVIKFKSDISDEIVNLYFRWKRATHRKEYKMEPKEYLRNYYVTDAMLLKAGDMDIAILFFCQVDNIVYLENLSYDSDMERFSPGYLIYELFLEELINRKCSSLYLGGGEYSYKKRFGAEESIAYSGQIYRKEVFEELNRYFMINKINKIAIYGLGIVGHSFLRISSLINIDIIYGIDREIRENDIPVYSPQEELEEVDAVIITLKFENKEVEDLLKTKFKRVYYWKDIIGKVIYNEGD